MKGLEIPSEFHHLNASLNAKRLQVSTALGTETSHAILGYNFGQFDIGRVTDNHIETSLRQDSVEVAEPMEWPVRLRPRPSGITSKPASRGHLKTGQLSASRTIIVLPYLRQLRQGVFQESSLVLEG